MIQVSNLTKYYGDFPAVTDLSFEIEDGHVYGFLGPNGAGKSTTMNIMTGCLSPTDGTVKIGGYDILEQPEQAKKLIGYLPEQPPVYLNETPVEYLTFVGEAKGLRGKQLREEIDSVIEKAGIENVCHRLIGALSKGYRQRVGIAQALLGNPQVIILDEPTVGLDPIQIIEIRDFIKELGETHTVILSSHILSEVQAVCEKVLIISKGKLVAFDTPENLEKHFITAASVTFSVEASKDVAEEILSQAEGIANWNISESDGSCSISAELADGTDSKAVCGKLTLAFAAKGLPVFEMKTKQANLEDVFLELTESGSAEDIYADKEDTEDDEYEDSDDNNSSDAEETSSSDETTNSDSNDESNNTDDLNSADNNGSNISNTDTTNNGNHQAVCDSSNNESEVDD